MFCPARLPARHDEGVAAELAGDGAGIAQHAGAKENTSGGGEFETHGIWPGRIITSQSRREIGS